MSESKGIDLVAVMTSVSRTSKVLRARHSKWGSAADMSAAATSWQILQLFE